MAEDVHWLRAQGQLAERSFLFVVDSAMRDKTAYPTPSDYVISLPMPLRNVFALDLVDATVPRTEYTVEKTSNTVVFAVSHGYATAEAAYRAGAAITATIMPGNYNLDSLVETLSAAMVAAALAKGVVPVRVAAVSDPPELTNRIKFMSSDAFAVFMEATTIRHVLGFGNPAHTAGANVSYAGTSLFTTTPSTKEDVFFSVPTSTVLETPTYAGPVAIELENYKDSLSLQTVIRQTFTAAESGSLHTIAVKGTTSTTTTIAVTVRQGATLIGETTMNAVATAGTWTADFASSTEPILAGTVYSVEFSGVGAEAVYVYSAETFTDDPNNAIYINNAVHSTTSAVSFDLVVSLAGHSVESPGQCNLTGERYLLIRSPDIEQHLHRNLAAAYDRMAPGMGLCKLGGFGFREERFNFLAYSTRTFHPIGKLREIRIRLEKRDGTLYDAHGIDHVLLFVAKMYVPAVSDAVMLGSSTLNPTYTPDIRKALVSKLERDLEY